MIIQCPCFILIDTEASRMTLKALEELTKLRDEMKMKRQLKRRIRND